jgi:hypothetical protein
MLEMIRKWGAEIAKAAKEKKGLEMQYAEAFRRIKLFIPKQEEHELKKEAELEA